MTYRSRVALKSIRSTREIIHFNQLDIAPSVEADRRARSVDVLTKLSVRGSDQYVLPTRDPHAAYVDLGRLLGLGLNRCLLIFRRQSGQIPALKHQNGN